MDNEDNKDKSKTNGKTPKDTVDAALADAPQDLTDQVVIDLAGLTPLEYAKRINKTAKACRVQVKHLEKLVETAKVEREAERLLEPHWEVTPSEDPVDAVQLFAEIEARILQHVVMPKDLAFVVALFVGQDWIHEHGTYSPILCITSAERDSGKSTLMGVIAFLVRRSLLSVGISSAALYRSIERWHPTFVLDECDELFADNPDLLRVINSGWTRGQGVVRCDPETNEPALFSTFCPKVIALKGKRMPDTMLSRNIFIEMKRRLRSEKVDHFRHLDDAGFQRMRSQLARWAQDFGEILGAARPAQPEDFMNRAASNWQLMFAIADSLGEEAGKRARAVAEHIVGVTDMASAGVLLLQDIKAMFDSSTLDYLTSKTIIERLTADPEKRWAEWSRGKPITEKGVAILLHEYHIFSRNVGGRDTQSKGYRNADFKDAWERYLEGGKAESGPKTDLFPSTRLPHWNDYGKGEKSAVHRDGGGREKIGPFSNEINAVDAWTAKTSPQIPSPPDCVDSDQDVAPGVASEQLVHDGLGDLRRCHHCGRPGAAQVAIDGRSIGLHRECEAPWMENQ
jgi:hypothetical protein